MYPLDMIHDNFTERLNQLFTVLCEFHKNPNRSKKNSYPIFRLYCQLFYKITCTICGKAFSKHNSHLKQGGCVPNYEQMNAIPIGSDFSDISVKLGNILSESKMLERPEYKDRICLCLMCLKEFDCSHTGKRDYENHFQNDHTYEEKFKFGLCHSLDKA